jgi:uncharacterized protein (TIGR02996 family)
METEEIAFLQTIRESPFEDTARLVYADWLEEHYQPERAEFIRLQCVLAELPDRDPKREALETRERRLWQRFSGQWRSKLPAGLRRFPFHRGFVQPREVELTGQELLSLPKAYLDAAPQWNVKLFLGANDPLEAGELLSRLTGLSLHIQGVDPTGLEEWLGSPHLKNVRSLNIEGHPFGISHVWAISSSSALRGLQRFGITCNHIGAEGAELIAGSENFRNLAALDLVGCGIGSAGLASLANSPHLSHLRVLNLQQNGLDTESASAIIASRRWRQLRRLGLYGNHLGDEGARVLALGKNLERLAKLDLGLNRIGPLGAQALASSPFLAKIGDLYLGGNRIGPSSALDVLRERFGDRVTV